MGEGTTTITNAAREPEIIDLQNFLNRMGAKVRGAGSNKIEVVGVKKLKDVSYNIMPDRIEVGTFLCMAAMTNGNLILEGVNNTQIIPIIDKLQECGCKIESKVNKIEISAPKRLRATDIKTMPYPGFPTDMQSIFATALTTARGTSVIVENIFENRYKYTQELIRMGARITIEGKTAIIKGVRRLYNANVKATDLRGGAALVMAALSTKGESKVDNIEYILRGYENFENKIQNIGGKIKEIKI
mgnify:FL=1